MHRFRAMQGQWKHVINRLEGVSWRACVSTGAPRTMMLNDFAESTVAGRLGLQFDALFGRRCTY